MPPRDLEAIKNQSTDELRYTGGVKSKFSKAVLKAMEKVTAEKSSIRTPMLVQYGENDRVCRPEATRNFFEDVNCEDKEQTPFFSKVANSESHPTLYAVSP